MKRWTLRVLAVFATLLGLQMLFSYLLRIPAISDAVRRFNREKLNPAMLRKAGHGAWYASVIETKGRKTGTIHRTPVVADPIAGGFIIPLPYGTEVDWLLNAQAAGHAVIKHHDIDYPVDEFKVMEPDLAIPMLPMGHRFSYRANGIERFLNARIAHTAGDTVGV